MSIAGESGAADRRVAIVAGVRDAAALLKVLSQTSAVVVGVVAHEQRESGRAGLAMLTSRARASGVPVLAPRGATIPMAVDWLRNLALDYLVSVGWSSLLTEELARVPRHGTVSFLRTPLLRTGRLVAPDWAQLRGETLTGHSMLVMAPGSATVGPTSVTPTGDAWLDGADDEAADPYEPLARLATRLLETEPVDAVGGGSTERRATGRLPGPASSPLGLTSFDRTAIEVHRWVRAMGFPRSGAFALMRGQIVRIWSCEPADSRAIPLPSGTLLGADDQGVVVTTRSGSVRLIEVQTMGQGPEPATSWFARNALPPGCAFEPVSWSTLNWMLPGGGTAR